MDAEIDRWMDLCSVASVKLVQLDALVELAQLVSFVALAKLVRWFVQLVSQLVRKSLSHLVSKSVSCLVS